MDYNLLTLAQLKNLAKEANIKGVSGLKKDELAALLSENEKKQQAEQKTANRKTASKTVKTTEVKEESARKDADKKEKPAQKVADKEEKPAQKVADKEEKPARKRTAKAAASVTEEEVGQKETDKTAKTTVKEAIDKTQKAAEKAEKREKEDTAKDAEESGESAPAQEIKPAPVRSRDSSLATREPVAPHQGVIRRENGAPVRRTVPGTRPMTGQMPVARPAGDVRPGQTRIIGDSSRPVGSARPTGETVRPSQPARPAEGQRTVAPSFDRNTSDVNHTETLASYIAQNYALAGTAQDSGETKEGILEVMPEGFAFVRCDNFLPGSEDVYVSPAQVKRFGLKTGDYIVGNTKVRMPNEKFSALYYINTVNKLTLDEVVKRKKFEDLTPIFPNQRFHLETPGCGPAMRMVDLLSPIGRGQRGMIVSQPKAGKTTLLKQIAKALIRNHPSIHLIILLIDERPEEVTDMKESINGDNVEVIYSTFDEQPENHKRVSEMVIERARRLVEQKQDVVILLDSITRLARAYNLTVQASGRTLSGGLDPAALYMPKKFFGAARCMREGGSLTVLATALVDTGSRMDDVVFEEFKGTGNMELVLDRNLSERRVFPAIDLPKSGTRREDLLLTPQELEASNIIRRAFNTSRTEEVVEKIINLFTHTRNNQEFIEMVKKTRIVP
ncbi:MAG: transcription termination factor Rho [Lachnospiraceae bacterium]|nr:transcription termination factor Rho [Lachnospiraceae bacterium]